MANPPELLVRVYFMGDKAVGKADSKASSYLVTCMIDKTVTVGKQYDNRAQAIHSAVHMFLNVMGTLE